MAFVAYVGGPYTTDPAPSISALVDERVRALVLDLEGVDFVDSQGVAKLTEIHEFLRVDDIGFRFARVKPHVLAVL